MSDTIIISNRYQLFLKVITRSKPEAAVQRCALKNFTASNFSPAQLISCESCVSFQNSFFLEHFPAAASVKRQNTWKTEFYQLRYFLLMGIILNCFLAYFCNILKFCHYIAEYWSSTIKSQVTKSDLSNISSPLLNHLKQTPLVSLCLKHVLMGWKADYLNYIFQEIFLNCQFFYFFFQVQSHVVTSV